MIKLIVGNKGSGKTKTLIRMVNEAVKMPSGKVVCVEKGLKLTYDISHQARLVDIEHYGVSGFVAFGGFLCGLMAGNYDITDIFVDATLRIGGRERKNSPKGWTSFSPSRKKTTPPSPLRFPAIFPSCPSASNGTPWVIKRIFLDNRKTLYYNSPVKPAQSRLYLSQPGESGGKP
jgi:energy-coupling factor transporter ATP-binding protein EcfA2